MNFPHRHWLLLAALLLASAITALPAIEEEDPDPAQLARDRVVAESLLRIKDFDITDNEKLQASVVRYAATIQGQESYFRLAQRFRIPALDKDLFQLATKDPSGTAGVRSAQVLAAAGQLSRFFEALRSTDATVAVGAATVLGQLDDPRIPPALASLIPDKSLPRSLRTAATYSLGKSLVGQRILLGIVQEKQLPDDLTVSATNVLFSSTDMALREAASKHLTLPPTADATPLPPIPVLLKQPGDHLLGKDVFNKAGTCIKCHRVRGEGKEVGPDLSEIGSKLTKEALLVSILDPSAGISHNYETYNIILNSGNIVSGLLVSKTDTAVTIKTAEAIDKVYSLSDIDEMVKSPVSLMPADIQKAMTAGELVNLLAFLSTLKKP
jgi:putative heme-binding domain-containing protein